MYGTGRVKKLKNYMGYQVHFLLPLKLQKYAILGYATKYSWSISLLDFLLLLLLVNLNTVIHYRKLYFNNIVSIKTAFIAN